jgi:hypothetical protein
MGISTTARLLMISSNERMDVLRAPTRQATSPPLKSPNRLDDGDDGVCLLRDVCPLTYTRASTNNYKRPTEPRKAVRMPLRVRLPRSGGRRRRGESFLSLEWLAWRENTRIISSPAYEEKSKLVGAPQLACWNFGFSLPLCLFCVLPLTNLLSPLRV